MQENARAEREEPENGNEKILLEILGTETEEK